MPALFYYWLFVTKRKGLAVVCVGVAAMVFLSRAPDESFNRVASIGTSKEDSSATGRLEAWGAAVKMAIDYPLGVGSGNFTSARSVATTWGATADTRCPLGEHAQHLFQDAG